MSQSSDGSPRTSILGFFPAHLSPRDEQARILLELEAKWHKHDLHVIEMPTGAGKTELAVTIAAWQAAQGHSTNILEPTNMLLDQVDKRYPGFATLHRQDAYTCEEMSMACPERKAACGGFCKGCSYLAARRDAKAAPIRLMNFYTYWAHRMYADVLIFDEAHQLVDMLSDKKDVRLWQSEHKFPRGLKLVTDVIDWAQAELVKGDNQRLHNLIRDVIKIRDGSIVEYREQHYRGRPDVCLVVHPPNAKSVPPWLWPIGPVRKMVFLSATINEQDVDALGLNVRRPVYLTCGSPIPADRRPLIYEPCVNMSHRLVDKAMPIFAQRLERLLAVHADKGIVHLPYSLAERLQGLVSHPRFMFHDRNNKTEMLDLFRASDPADGRVLVASGMYEGIDLPYDAARWQVIGKVPYLNLGSAVVRDRAERFPKAYAWAAAKLLIQAYGRITRAADDYGETFIWDVNFGRLYSQHRDLFPDFIQDAYREVKK